jgi:hypothetical protein
MLWEDSTVGHSHTDKVGKARQGAMSILLLYLISTCPTRQLDRTLTTHSTTHLD